MGLSRISKRDTLVTSSLGLRFLDRFLPSIMLDFLITIIFSAVVGLAVFTVAYHIVKASGSEVSFAVVGALCCVDCCYMLIRIFVLCFSIK